jgi:peptide/nickel transport system substrate-binding protein
VRLERFVLLTLILVLVACAGPPPAAPASRGGESEAGQSAATQPSRTLRMVLRTEPDTFAPTRLATAGPGTRTPARLFNAGLVLPDAEERPQPYLADRLPQLNTDSWKVSLDGSMETVYGLHSGLTWQDGTPLTAEDFVFAHRVYTTPEFGLAGLQPQSVMESVVAEGAGTIRIRWRAPFPDAGALRGYGSGAGSTFVFTALPRHILERAYEDQRATFPSLAFWGTEYLGLGPYKLDRWEPGAFIEGVAFDHHALGRPKIDRVRITFSADFNATLANLLAGEADMPVDDSIRLQEGLILQREWGPRNAGSVLFLPRQWRVIQVQMRSEYAAPRLLLDARVRKALAHSLDRSAIGDALFEGQAIVSDTPFPPGDPTGTALESAVIRYPLDPRRTEQLMAEVGASRDREGFFTVGEGRISVEVKNIQSAQNDAERSIMAHGWRQVGFEIEERAFTPTEAQDGQARATFRALHPVSIAQGPPATSYLTTAAVARPETRWNGQNRGGFTNPVYDQFEAGFRTTLDPAERTRHLAGAIAILSDQLPVLPLYFNPGVLAYPAGLRGVDLKAGDGEVSWNVHQWELR